MINTKFKIIFISIVLGILMLPSFVLAVGEMEYFKAKVLEINNQDEIIRDDGTKQIQQDLKLKGLSGESWKGREFEFQGISEVDVFSSNVYKAGDKVIVTYEKDVDGNDLFMIQDYVRTSWIFWITILFIIVSIIVGKWKGFKAILTLALTFLVIMKLIIPRIIEGTNPILIAVIGGLLILFIIIYLTEGFNRKSNIAIVSIFISLFITGGLAYLFTWLTRLTGATEEAMFLLGTTPAVINFKGLLLAGIIIGTLGVLDDVVIAQISTVEQLKESNPNLTNKEVYRSGMKVGVSHIASMVNTLFLAYAGVSLPLLLLFGVQTQPFISFSMVLNNEAITTEIVRTLTGSIGLILSVPIATYLAAKYIKTKV